MQFTTLSGSVAFNLFPPGLLFQLPKSNPIDLGPRDEADARSDRKRKNNLGQNLTLREISSSPLVRPSDT